MFRNELKPDCGMLFVFDEEGKYNFWMKNMLIPLDVIWIGPDKKINDIMKEVKPCLGSCEGFTSKEKAKYVLEVISGFADKHNLKSGEAVRF